MEVVGSRYVRLRIASDALKTREYNLMPGEYRLTIQDSGEARLDHRPLRARQTGECRQQDIGVIRPLK